MLNNKYTEYRRICDGPISTDNIVKQIYQLDPNKDLQ